MTPTTDDSISPLIYVVGSCNFDLTIETSSLPSPAETRLGNDYLAFPGGKGANQALGLHKLGSKVRFLGRVGKDHYGEQILAQLQQQGLGLADVCAVDDLPTGLALITLDKMDRRTIVVAPGANKAINDKAVQDFLAGAPGGSVLVTQLEIPTETVCNLLQLAKRRDMLTVLHASPVAEFPRDALRLVDLLVLNQSELHQLSGRSAQHLETATRAANELLHNGCKTILVTMGTRGVLVVTRDGHHFVRGYKEEVLDASVGSSAFIAGLAHHRAHNPASPLDDAIEFGLAAMALALGRTGGQASLPTADEVAVFLKEEQKHEILKDNRSEKLRALEERANALRKRIIRMLAAAHSGHPGGSLSLVEVLTVLYFNTMVYNPHRPDWEERDRLVLSKGHAAPALYSTLIEAGFLDPSLETELRKLGSPLQGHPDKRKCVGVEMSTGSLGQGLSVANGMALAARHLQRRYHVYCILGDGEIQEGQVWEAAMTAAHYGLDNLCAIIDYNALQIGGSISKVKSPIEPLAEKWTAFGWNVLNVDGHDLTELCLAFEEARKGNGKPTMVVAHTIKGRGVSFMEGVIDYHGSTLSPDEVKRALAELESGSQS